MSISGAFQAQETLERRATVRLKYYWSSLRRNGTLPSFRDFDPQRNPVAWSHCFLATHDPGCGKPVFDHVGAALWTHADPQVPNRGHRGGQLPLLLKLACADLELAWASAEPIERSGHYNLPSGGRLLFRSILLPFLIEPDLRYLLGAATSRIA